MKKNYSKYSDQELFAALKSSKREAEAAFAEIYARHSQRIYAYCLRVTGDQQDAQDIFQEAFFKFFDSVKKKDSMDNLPAYLLIITRNLCLNYKRDKKIKVDIEDYKYFTNNNNYEEKELLDLIARALDCLDFDYKEAFILRQYQGMSYKEISKITGDSVAAIKNRVWRAKEKIKDILSPYLEDLSK